MINFFETLGNITINEDQRDEFREMYMKVASAGGMMSVEEIKIFGRDFTLLAPLKIEEDGRVEITYNYFEDNWWETGCFDYKKGRVHNFQVGWRQFSIVSSALQLLAEFNSSTDGYISKGKGLSLEALTGWLNYALGKNYHLKKRRNALHMYEMLKEKYQEFSMNDLCDELEAYGVCSQHELLSRVFAERPVDEAMNFFENSDHSKQVDSHSHRR